ncbi:c-type cytochrome [Leifsonia sp. SIMBA_070]
MEKGIETLYDHAINGFNAMPAKGGNMSLSDDDVKAAVDYIVEPVQ